MDERKVAGLISHRNYLKCLRILRGKVCLANRSSKTR